MDAHRRADDVTLREYLETLIQAEAARSDARAEAHKTALDIQTHSIDTHLAALNGQQARLAEERANFLTRDLHDAFLREYHEWQRRVDNQLAVTTGRERGVSLVWSVGIAVIGVAVAIVGTFFAIFSRNPG